MSVSCPTYIPCMLGCDGIPCSQLAVPGSTVHGDTLQASVYHFSTYEVWHSGLSLLFLAVPLKTKTVPFCFLDALFLHDFWCPNSLLERTEWYSLKYHFQKKQHQMQYPDHTEPSSLWPGPFYSNKI